MTALTDSPADLAGVALSAAAAAAEVLPAATPLVAGTPVPGGTDATAGLTGAAIAELHLPGVPASPCSSVPTSSRPWPAARSAGSTSPPPPSPRSRPRPVPSAPAAVPPREVAVDLVLGDLGGATVVPLLGDGVPAGALLVSDAAVASVEAMRATEMPAATASRAAAPAGSAARGIEMLHGVDMEVTVELGRARLTVRELLALSPGEVLELDRAAGSPADLLVNGRLIARGEVVVVDEDFGLRITEIVDESAAG
ncbi:flagellar motor switch protein FliN [Nocardioides okcheonensis]|uniref:flagellar motor switch protein FliN n=1 Tax=Nocardioides okcheonensis TaxID=2894081 RepID=UPI001E294671|nr:flagellar motor switch protein FliN [Nocardioides okcheonensis]UFN43203.1 flagellar motor switch protein FliN [Nocardioides okcheonensis]